MSSSQQSSYQPQQSNYGLPTSGAQYNNYMGMYPNLYGGSQGGKSSGTSLYAGGSPGQQPIQGGQVPYLPPSYLGPIGGGNPGGGGGYGGSYNPLAVGQTSSNPLATPGAVGVNGGLNGMPGITVGNGGGYVPPSGPNLTNPLMASYVSPYAFGPNAQNVDAAGRPIPAWQLGGNQGSLWTGG